MESNDRHEISANQCLPHSVLSTIRMSYNDACMYVDDMIVTGNDEKEIALLNVRLGKKFEVKGLG
jgi:hypothetical protein